MCCPSSCNRQERNSGPSSASPPNSTTTDCTLNCCVTLQEKPRCCVFVPTGGQPAQSITLHADGRDPGGSYTWTARDPAIVRVNGSGSTATVTGLRPGATDIEVTYNCPNGRQARDTTRCIAFQVALEHPSGDPVTNGSATNEFTFDNATPGVLRVQCRARITPNDADAIACAGDHLRWTIDAVGSSTLAWSDADPGNPARGRGVNTTATFTDLPANNTDFGAKTVTLLLNGATIETTTIEVFYPKAASNHPNPGQGTTPNWFFYWMQVIGSPAHVRYGGAGPGGLFGETRAMTQWAYGPGLPNKTLIHIFDTAAASDGAIAGLHGPLTGIDLFRNTVLHESEHANQIARADPVVGIHAGTCWENGWSWNVANHNHWRLGPGRAAGAAGICTAAGPGGMGTHASDVVLEAPNPPSVALPTSDWPTAWGAIPAGAGPGGTYIGGDHIEQQAFQQETGPEHGLARQDWSDPGKNHRTVDRFND